MSQSCNMCKFHARTLCRRHTKTPQANLQANKFSSYLKTFRSHGVQAQHEQAPFLPGNFLRKHVVNARQKRPRSSVHCFQETFLEPWGSCTTRTQERTKNKKERKKASQKERKNESKEARKKGRKEDRKKGRKEERKTGARKKARKEGKKGKE